MIDDASLWEDYVTSSAKALGLSLEPSWKEGASQNIETIFKLAAALEAFELPDDIEPAPIFKA